MYNIGLAYLYLFVRVVFLIALWVLGGKILIDKHKQRKVAKSRVVFTIIIFILFILANIFMLTHKVYYKYCDAWIKGKSLEQVTERYGEFDYLWESKELEGGKAGYFIYHDDGFMADHQDHYLMMEYDADGYVIKVYDSNQ